MHSILCIDAGHGGIDPGARCAGIRESDVALLWAADLRTCLERRGHTVVMTRSDDTARSLSSRADAANAAGAHAFVSLHLNQGAVGARGFQAFHARPSAAGRELAEAVCAAVRGIVGRAHVFPDASVHTGYTRAAREFVDALPASLSWAERDERARTRFGPRGAYRSLAVLRRTRMPAVLLELGFLSDREERTRLCHPGYRRRVNLAIADGIDAWLSEGGSASPEVGADDPTPAPELVGVPQPITRPPYLERTTMVKLAVARSYAVRDIEKNDIAQALLHDLTAFYDRVTDLRSASLRELWHVARDLVAALDRWAGRIGGMPGEEKMELALDVAFAWIEHRGGLEALRERILDELEEQPLGWLTTPVVRQILSAAVLRRIVRFVLELAVSELRQMRT